MFGGAIGLTSISLNEPVKSAVSDRLAPPYRVGVTVVASASGLEEIDAAMRADLAAAPLREFEQVADEFPVFRDRAANEPTRPQVSPCGDETCGRAIALSSPAGMSEP